MLDIHHKELILNNAMTISAASNFVDLDFSWRSVRGRRGRDRMVVGFTTTYAISAYHH